MARKKDNPYKTRGGFDALLEEQLQDPEIRVVYERERALTDIAMAVRQLRRREGMTQAELARRIETSQPAIARLESGRGQRFPTLPLLGRIAAATDSRISLSFVPDAVPRRDSEEEIPKPLLDTMGKLVRKYGANLAAATLLSLREK